MKTFPVSVITVFLLLPFFFFGMIYPINSTSSSSYLGPQQPEPYFLQGDIDNFLQKPPEIQPLQIPSTTTQTSSTLHENTIEKSSISTTRQSKCKLI